MTLPPHLLSSICCLLPFAFLWWRLIDHLRVEWSVNAQYGYGWAVPWLCGYLIWRSVRAADGSSQSRVNSCSTTTGQGKRFLQLPTPIFYLLFTLGALLYAPTRLIEEANPEWRLVSWALAAEVVGITLLFAYVVAIAGWKAGEGESKSAISSFPLRDIAFGICFFLVAVPWPTVIEGPLIQALTRANASTTVELMQLAGIPAVQRGNVIEIATGVVGIDEACSGIRSFQAALMISLFLGELYRLNALRRIGLVAAGFAMSFVFNVGRTTLLVWVASRKGVAAISSWHDPAGVAILLCCFFGLWGLAVWLRRQREWDKGSRREGSGEEGTKNQGSEARSEMSAAGFQISAPSISSLSASRAPSSALHPPSFRLVRLAIVLGAWLVLVEVSVEWWYRSHEARLAKSAIWTVNLPGQNPTLRKLPMSEATQRILRYDEAVNVLWEEQGRGYQVIFLRWNPGRTALHLAKGHTPEVCLTAAGRKLAPGSNVRQFHVRGLRMPFRNYAVIDEGQPLHVFYCLWDDLAGEQSFDTMSLSYGNRLGPVLAGRRNPGQRSLEIAVWGIADAEAAAVAVRQELEKLVVVK